MDLSTLHETVRALRLGGAASAEMRFNRKKLGELSTTERAALRAFRRRARRVGGHVEGLLPVINSSIWIG